MGKTTIGREASKLGAAAFVDSGDDDGTRRTIGRQVKFVCYGLLVLVVVFLSATANAVFTIDAESISADRARAQNAIAEAMATGINPSNTLVRQVAETFVLKDARLTTMIGVEPGESIVPMADGFVMAYRPLRLGTETFQALGPTRLVVGAALALGVVLILQRLMALAKLLDARRIAARRLAVIDPLTGLSNRLDFNECLESRIANPAGRGGALLLLDLDGFKAINDRHGHVVGDRLLQEIAQRLKAHALPGDTVARLGGDEFAVVRQHGLTRNELGTFAQGLVHLVCTPCRIDGQNIAVSVSIGIARIEPEMTEPETVVRAADDAMYRAKSRPGGTYEFAGPAPRRPMEVLAQTAA